MSPLSSRLKAMAKHVAALEREGSPDALAALLRLEVALAEVEALLPARQRGRPKKAEFPRDFMAGLVDVLKGAPPEILGAKIATDMDALRWLHKGKPFNSKTLRNQLARARKRR